MGFRVGDLLRARNKIQVGVVRIYTEQNCSEWETHVKKGETFVLLDEHQNSWKQDVCKVLFPRGIRWVYRLDVEVVE
jgi:hypothetical protein